MVCRFRTLATRCIAMAMAIVAAACDGPGEGPVRAPSVNVAEGHPLADQLWPALLQHCRRNPSCDPMSAFGVGENQASGIALYSTWFAEKAVSLEDGDQFGDRVRISLFAYRGEGGEAGRPLSVREREGNLRAYRDGLSRLTIEYREIGGEMAPLFASVRTQQVVFDVPGVEEMGRREDIVEATRAHVDNWVWPSGDRGVEIELSGESAPLLNGLTAGGASRTTWEGEDPEVEAREPWTFLLQAPLESRADAPLVEALRGDGFVRMVVRAPDGGVVLRDAFAAGGHEAALAEAMAALEDERIALPLTERCARFVGWDNDDWATAEGLSPSEETCDPLTDIGRRRILDQQPSGSPM